MSGDLATSAFFHFLSWNMVSIIEVEIFGFLPFSNWPDFDQKMFQNRSFWASNGSKSGYLVSRWRPKDALSFVCQFVRSYVTWLLENCSLLFSETMRLGRTWVGDKNVPSGSRLILFNPIKMKKELCFSFFLQIGTLELSNFFPVKSI